MSNGQSIKLQKKLCFRRSITTFLLVVSVIEFLALLILGFDFVRNHGFELGLPKIESQAPYQKEIKKIIKPLRYSGLQALLRPDVRISLDFQKRSWILHNIHRFDDQGRVVLEEGHYGVCNELSAYVYGKVRPLLGSNYEIEFVRTAESGFFPIPDGSHVILRIIKPSLFGEHVYILDPSFHRYGSIDKFNDYLFIDTISYPFFSESRTDESFNVNNGPPLSIKKNYLLGLIVEEINGKFDQDNFILALTATRRNHYAGRYIFAVRKNSGELQQIENKNLIKMFLEEEEYHQIRQKLVDLFENLLVNYNGG